MTKFNCWEFKKCGRHPDDGKVEKSEICPATQSNDYNGINNGKLGGCFCWAVTGTFCENKTQGAFAEKFLNCIYCDFFKKVNEEEGHSFSLTLHDANKKLGKDISSDTVNSKSQLKNRKKILIIDDDESLTTLLQRVLKKKGYMVWVENDSTKAYESFTSTPDLFDLIIIDYCMPVVTGDELSAMILKINPDMPIIMCTGYSFEFTEKMALEIGIRNYCTKPLAKNELIAMIEDALQV